MVVCQAQMALFGNFLCQTKGHSWAILVCQATRTNIIIIVFQNVLAESYFVCNALVI